MNYAFRQLTKSPGFAVLAVLTLALGIGVNTTTFSLVNALLYRQPPFRDASRLVEVYGSTPGSPQLNQSPANIRDELAQQTVFERAAAYTYAASNLAHPGEPADRVNAFQVGGEFFAILGVPPLLGRTFTPSDDRPGFNKVVVVSEQFWREKLGANPDVVGSTLRLDANPVTVVGVMPSAFQDVLHWGAVQIWQPLGYDSWTERRSAWLSVIARLKPGVSRAAAQGQMTAIASRLAHDFPDENTNFGIKVSSYTEVRTQGSVQMSWIIMGLMLLVLLIACVNLANLQLARTLGRTREFAVRTAVGATRRQLVWQLLKEGLLLSLAGGFFGLLVAVWGNRLVGSRLLIGSDSRGFDLPLDFRVLGFTTAASVVTGLIVGMVPAMTATNTDVGLALKQGGRGSVGSRSKHRLRQSLVISELALALGLLASAAYIVRGVQRYQRFDTGWSTANLVTGSIALPWNTYTNADQMSAVASRLEASLAAVPGVEHVAISGTLPVYSFSGFSGFLIDGQNAPEKGEGPSAFTESVSPDFFPTLGVHLLAGRGFTAADRKGAKAVVIINRTMAEKFWPAGDALGRRIGILADPKKPDWREIVGIVSDVSFVGNNNAGSPRYQTYHPVAQDPDHYLTFTVRCAAAPSSLFDPVRKAITQVDPDVAVSGLVTVDQMIEQGEANLVLIEQLLSVAAVIGLLLALLGIYGVIANLAAQRTQEIGIRMALGAQKTSVLWLIVRNGAVLAVAGTAIGLLLALGLTRLLSVAMPWLPGQDPLLLAALALLLVVATLLASWVPARRAMKVDPIVALRDE